MKTHHTPGPWLTVTRGSNQIVQIGTDCFVTSTNLDRPMGDANARLIGSAPDLLAALELAIPMIDRYAAGSATVLDTMRSAIAAARGEG